MAERLLVHSLAKLSRRKDFKVLCIFSHSSLLTPPTSRCTPPNSTICFPLFLSRFVIQLPFPSVVSSVHILSGDACLAVSTLEFGVTCDDLHACQYDTSTSLRNRRASYMRQQQLATASPSELLPSSLYTVTPHQPQSCLVMRCLLQHTQSASFDYPRF